MGMPYKNKDAQQKAQRDWYMKNRLAVLRKQEENREAVTHRTKLSRQAKRQLVCEAKSVPCTDCGVMYPPRVMDLDHVRGDKIGNVTSMVNANASWDEIQTELAKCEVVCANCHRLRHIPS